MDDHQKLDSTIQLLTLIMPEMDEIIAGMEQAGGWFPVEAQGLLEIVKTLKIENWAELYLDEQKLKGLAVSLAMDEEQHKAAVDHPEAVLEALKASSIEHLSTTVSAPSKAAIEKTAKDQTDLIKNDVLAVYCFLTSLFNGLANMVHGQSLCQLVSAAQGGNDDALCKAIQIDRTILFLPFVKDRLIKAQFSNDEAFLNNLAYRLKQPILKTKLRYRTLWLTFALLEDEGLLSLPHEQLLDVCEAIGVYGKEHGIEDVGYLRKRLSAYKKRNKPSNNF